MALIVKDILHRLNRGSVVRRPSHLTKESSKSQNWITTAAITRLCIAVKESDTLLGIETAPFQLPLDDERGYGRFPCPH